MLKAVTSSWISLFSFEFHSAIYLHRKLVFRDSYSRCRTFILMKSLEFTLNCSHFISSVCFLACALFSLNYQSNFFTAFPLLIIVVASSEQKYEPLATILKSVLQNKVMIMGSWLLLLIMLYIFSSAGFFLYSRSYFLAEPGENACLSMVTCFLSTASLGLRSAGGVADQLQHVSYSQKDVYFMRLAFDELAFILVNVLGMNILFGVLLDSLSEQRIKQQAIEHALAKRCFICGIEKEWVRFAHAARPQAQWLRRSRLAGTQHLELLQVHLLRPQEKPLGPHRSRQVRLGEDRRERRLPSTRT